MHDLSYLASQQPLAAMSSLKHYWLFCINRNRLKVEFRPCKVGWQLHPIFHCLKEGLTLSDGLDKAYY